MSKSPSMRVHVDISSYSDEGFSLKIPSNRNPYDKHKVHGVPDTVTLILSPCRVLHYVAAGMSSMLTNASATLELSRCQPHLHTKLRCCGYTAASLGIRRRPCEHLRIEISHNADDNPPCNIQEHQLGYTNSPR